MQDQKPTKGLRGFFQRLREYGARFNSYELKYEGEHPWRYLSFLGGVIITVVSMQSLRIGGFSIINFVFVNSSIISK